MERYARACDRVPKPSNRPRYHASAPAAKTEEPPKKPATEPVFEPIVADRDPLRSCQSRPKRRWNEEKKPDADKVPERSHPAVVNRTKADAPKP